MSRSSWKTLAAAVLLTASVPVLAHHAFSSEFDATAPVTLKGQSHGSSGSTRTRGFTSR